MLDTTQSYTEQVLELTNDFREENGLQPLKWDPELASAAQEHSDNMGEQDFFSHTGQDGFQPWDRTEAAGDDNTSIGENIAAGQATPEEVVQAWIDSPGHRENMLNPNYEYLGVGYHEENPDTGSVNYQYYWTQNFGGGGTPPSNEPVGDNSGSEPVGDNPNNEPVGDNSGSGSGGGNPDNNSGEDFAKQVLELTNDFRGENGLQPLKWDPELASAAQEHSDNMGEQDFFSHTGQDGSLPWDRTEAAGDDNTSIGENIAAGQSNPEEVVQAWIDSPGHRENMLNPDYEYLGVGYHEENPDTGSVNYQYYWTQNFGGGGTPPSDQLGSDPVGENTVSTEKDMLMGKSDNEALAGDFGSNDIATNNTYEGIENYNPEFIWGQNQNQNFQKQQDSMLITDANYDGLGMYQSSSEDLMSLIDNYLAEFNQTQGNQFADCSKYFSELNSFFG